MNLDTQGPEFAAGEHYGFLTQRNPIFEDELSGVLEVRAATRLFGFIFGVTRGAGLCALAVSAAAAAAVPSMNSRRLVGKANSLLHLNGCVSVVESLSSVRSNTSGLNCSWRGSFGWSRVAL